MLFYITWITFCIYNSMVLQLVCDSLYFPIKFSIYLNYRDQFEWYWKHSFRLIELPAVSLSIQIEKFKILVVSRLIWEEIDYEADTVKWIKSDDPFKWIFQIMNVTQFGEDIEWFYQWQKNRNHSARRVSRSISYWIIYFIEFYLAQNLHDKNK